MLLSLQIHPGGRLGIVCIITDQPVTAYLIRGERALQIVNGLTSTNPYSKPFVFGLKYLRQLPQKMPDEIDRLVGNKKTATDGWRSICRRQTSEGRIVWKSGDVGQSHQCRRTNRQGDEEGGSYKKVSHGLAPCSVLIIR